MIEYVQFMFTKMITVTTLVPVALACTDGPSSLFLCCLKTSEPVSPFCTKDPSLLMLSCFKNSTPLVQCCGKDPSHLVLSCLQTVVSVALLWTNGPAPFTVLVALAVQVVSHQEKSWVLLINLDLIRKVSLKLEKLLGLCLICPECCKRDLKNTWLKVAECRVLESYIVE